MVRKIMSKVPKNQLETDLEKYRLKALKMGATDARIITADDIISDERVIAKCAYPKCISYGTNANCPPYAMSIDQVRKVIVKFSSGIFIKLDVPSAVIAGKKVSKNKRIPYQKKLYEIVSKIEAEAFYEGYYFAVGFGSGSCKRLFCPDADCAALITGKSCIHPYNARSSMEAVGMDVFAMATNAGWEIYPIGRNIPPEKIPYGLILGLILIY